MNLVASVADRGIVAVIAEERCEDEWRCVVFTFGARCTSGDFFEVHDPSDY